MHIGIGLLAMLLVAGCAATGNQDRRPQDGSRIVVQFEIGSDGHPTNIEYPPGVTPEQRRKIEATLAKMTWQEPIREGWRQMAFEFK